MQVWTIFDIRTVHLCYISVPYALNGQLTQIDARMMQLMMHVTVLAIDCQMMLSVLLYHVNKYKHAKLKSL